MEKEVKHKHTEKKEHKATSSKEKEVVIDIKGLKKSFGDKEVLKDINLTLYKGENLVVLGRSGSGKSVLIKCIIGLNTPDKGKIEVLGKDISQLDEDGMNELRVKMGFLFQSGALYDSMDVYDNLAFSLRIHQKELKEDEIQKLVEEALDNVGLKEAIHKMPAELSGGMRKRIGLARTIIMKPEIIFYDEPTTGLDTATSKEISELILKIQKKYKTSSIIITHDMPCAQITGDRIAVLKEGEYYKEGSFDELAEDDDEFVKSFFYKI